MNLDVNNVDTCQVIVYIYLFSAGAYRNDVLFHTLLVTFSNLSWQIFDFDWIGLLPPNVPSVKFFFFFFTADAESNYIYCR